MRRLLLLLSLAAGLSGCYVVSPYYPAYVPAYPAPAPGPPPPASRAQTAPPGSARNCQTVTVEAHSETRVMPDGRRETVSVPSHQQQMCQ
jgi:hypothetical protein